MPALRAHAATTGLRVAVIDAGVGRYGPGVEAAVYFACLEALQNASKHAPASTVEVTLLEDAGAGALVFEVQDDGAGFDPQAQPSGLGLTNMRDRVTALGGSLDITSTPDLGTCVRGRVPVAVS